MAGSAIHHLAFAFGLMGNLISFMVYLAPIPTFYRIFKSKTTAGFQSLPYVVALFSSMLWIYYAFIKTNAALLITINAVGCVIETVYIVIFLVYASTKARIHTAKLLVLLNVGLFGLIVLITLVLLKGAMALKVLGWICVGFSVSVFAAPLSIIRLVIRTKSVEYMPFFLSFFLTISAIAWFGYGLFSRDIYIALPNVLGFSFGVAQMILYMCYKDSKPKLAKTAGPATVLDDVAVEKQVAGKDIVAIDMVTLHAVVAAAVAAATGNEQYQQSAGAHQQRNVSDQTANTHCVKGVQNGETAAGAGNRGVSATV